MSLDNMPNETTLVIINTILYGLLLTFFITYEKYGPYTTFVLSALGWIVGRLLYNFIKISLNRRYR
tara:strand:+ start:967 stop:1164 length:198 start_codon:yes stop_codon:yes gene_type:complete